MRHASLVAAALLLGACGPRADTAPAAAPLDLAQFEMIDLAHSHGADTVYWPTDKEGFRKDVVFAGALAKSPTVSYCTARCSE